MCSIEWLCCRWPWVTPNHLKPPKFLHFVLTYASSSLVISKTSNFMYRLNVQVTAYRWQTVTDRGVVRSCDPLQNFGGSNHITGPAEPKVVKFCTQVGYISSSNRMTYHPQKGHGYGHATVLKFFPLLWCSTSRGFISDSWANCKFWGPMIYLEWLMLESSILSVGYRMALFVQLYV